MTPYEELLGAPITDRDLVRALNLLGALCRDLDDLRLNAEDMVAEMRETARSGRDERDYAFLAGVMWLSSKLPASLSTKDRHVVGAKIEALGYLPWEMTIYGDPVRKEQSA